MDKSKRMRALSRKKKKVIESEIDVEKTNNLIQSNILA